MCENKGLVHDPEKQNPEWTQFRINGHNPK